MITYAPLFRSTLSSIFLTFRSAPCGEIVGSREQLRHIRFSLNAHPSPIHIYRILEACAKRIIVLDLEFRQAPELNPQSAASQDMIHLPETRLHELRIRLKLSAFNTYFLEPLLARSPRLKALSLDLSPAWDPPGAGHGYTGPLFRADQTCH